jgi:uroporphyrin-III C-methyltransferase
MSASPRSRFSSEMIDPASSRAQAGKVYIVGAGPGHPGLLTIKAAELLRSADVVVYDRLIQEEVLALVKPSAERVYMGKPIGKHDSRQDEIHDLLLRKAREGKMVVRLKGGDPFVFGRGGEEAEYLADHGVTFEVIPGVSSAIAAPLSAGIALTHRDCASSVAIVTGHEAKKEQSGLDWQALSRMETLVFLMAVNNVAIIAQRLMEHGKNPGTPAAMIQMAFWHNEQVITGTLATIADDARHADIKPPATLVVGEVVRLREKLRASQRDLRRRPDDSPRFEPAPAPDQLFRLATAGIGSQVLRLALALGMFDHLDEFRQAAELAGALDLRPDTLAEVLDNLVAMGLLETAPQGYRNLELASR